MNVIFLYSILGVVYNIYAISIGNNQKNSNHIKKIKNKSKISEDNRRSTESDYIFNVLIQEASDSSIHYCSGVIISKFWVLSAAHCLDGYPDDPIGLFVKAGINKMNMLEGNLQVRYVARIFYPPEYKITGVLGLDNDVALLRLVDSLIFSTTVGAINIYNSDTLIEQDAYEVLGWGANIEDSMEMGNDENLYRAKVNYTKIIECKRYIDVYTDKFCHGGALILFEEESGSYWIVGLTSFGSRNCDPTKLMSFSKVSIYYKWIDSINEELLR